MDFLYNQTYQLYRSTTLFGLQASEDGKKVTEIKDLEATLLKKGENLKEVMKKRLAWEIKGLESTFKEGGEMILELKDINFELGLRLEGTVEKYLTLFNYEILLKPRYQAIVNENPKSTLFSLSDDLQAKNETLSFLKLQIVLVIYTNQLEPSMLSKTMILTKGGGKVLPIALDFIENEYKARISQYYILPYQLKSLLSLSLELILKNSKKAPKLNPLELIFKIIHHNDPSSKYVKEAPEDKSTVSTNSGLNTCTLSLEWDNVKTIFDLCMQDKSSANRTGPAIGELVLDRLNDHFHQVVGYPLNEMILTKAITPVVLLNDIGKMKFIKGFSTSLYHKLIIALLLLA